MEHGEPRTSPLPRGASAGDEPALDPRWHALAEGRLPPDQVEALRALAEQSDEGRLLWELYRPCDEAEKRGFADLMHRQIEVERAAAGRGLLAWWRRRSPVKWLAPALIGAAAALTPLYLGLTGPALDLAWSVDRGEAGAELQLASPEAPLTWTIVSRAKPRGPLRVIGSLLVHEGQARAWAAPASALSAEGEIVIAGLRRTVFPCVPAGPWEVLVAVGEPREAPAPAEMIREAERRTERGYQVLKRRVVLGGPTVDAEGGSSCDEPPR